MAKKLHLFLRLEKLAKVYPRLITQSEHPSEQEQQVYQIILDHHIREQVQMGLQPDEAQRLVTEKLAPYNKKVVVELYTHQPMMLGIPINWFAFIAFMGCVAASMPFAIDRMAITAVCALAWGASFAYCTAFGEALIQKRIDNILTQGITENGF